MSISNHILLNSTFDLDEALTTTTAAATTTIKPPPPPPPPSSSTYEVVLDELPNMNVNVNGDGDDSVCCVCMEALQYTHQGSDCKRLSCGHVYHRDCILTWLCNSRHFSCPLCRHIVFHTHSHTIFNA
ncbi:hypothetical protein RND81_06G162800 [Saponaria officinalis]|uniref:RING-type E3 ubiquitin transferase n=1 Tax=Saponaria officinalis TaxID=3572 RepID=A0AAW1KBR1_SAPOF